MKERPILMSAPMVRAILYGIKTETRRVVKLPLKDPLTGCEIAGCELNGLMKSHSGVCPYGQSGDRLWVKETFATHDDRTPPILYYRADDETTYPDDGKWKPSIFMPRWASRITLEIVDVRVERLRDITEDGAKAEGCKTQCDCGECIDCTPIGHFQDVWRSINGYDSWEANPWVWVLRFRRIKP